MQGTADRGYWLLDEPSPRAERRDVIAYAFSIREADKRALCFHLFSSLCARPE